MFFGDKRRDYAQAHVPEYWIVDPAEQRITVLALDGDNCAVFGEFTPGDETESKVLDGFRVNVSSVLQGS